MSDQFFRYRVSAIMKQLQLVALNGDRMMVDVRETMTIQEIAEWWKSDRCRARILRGDYVLDPGMTVGEA